MEPEYVCYCFKLTKEDLEEDVLVHGESTIMTKVTAAAQDDDCKCKKTNPKGECCIAGIRQVVEHILGKDKC